MACYSGIMSRLCCAICVEMGVPSFEFDFPPGIDMMAEIREGPAPAERMEAELCGRLYGVQNELDVPARGTEQDEEHT